MKRSIQMPQCESLIEALRHVPNPLALAAQMRPGGGSHRTDRRNPRRDRRATRSECRTMEG
jgi:hypothetical protein